MPLEPSSLQHAPVLLAGGGQLTPYFRIVKVGLFSCLYRVVGNGVNIYHKNALLFFFLYSFSSDFVSLVLRL